MRESASTDLREPQGSNPLGPPGPELWNCGRQRPTSQSLISGPAGFSWMPGRQPWDSSVSCSWPRTNASSLKVLGTPHPRERILTLYRSELPYQMAKRPEMSVLMHAGMRAPKLLPLDPCPEKLFSYQGITKSPGREALLPRPRVARVVCCDVGTWPKPLGLTARIVPPPASICETQSEVAR